MRGIIATRSAPELPRALVRMLLPRPLRMPGLRGPVRAGSVAWTAVKGTHCVLRLDTRNGALPRVTDGE